MLERYFISYSNKIKHLFPDIRGEKTNILVIFINKFMLQFVIQFTPSK